MVQAIIESRNDIVRYLLERPASSKLATIPIRVYSIKGAQRLMSPLEVSLRTKEAWVGYSKAVGALAAHTDHLCAPAASSMIRSAPFVRTARRRTFSNRMKETCPTRLTDTPGIPLSTL